MAQDFSKNPTEMVVQAILEGRDIKEFLGKVRMPTVPELLNGFMGRRDISTEALFEQAGMSRSFGFRVINGSRAPSRDALLRLAFVLELKIDETQQLLKAGEEATLSGSRMRDMIIMKALNDGASLGDAEDILQQSGMEPLLAK